MEDLLNSVKMRVKDFGTAARRVKITYYIFHIINICCSVINTVISALDSNNHVITIFSSISLGCLYIISNLNLVDTSDFLLYQEKYSQLYRQMQNAEIETSQLTTFIQNFNELESASRHLQANIFFGSCPCK